MGSLSEEERFPGVRENADGTIDFSLTDEEAREADVALRAFKGILIHPEAAEKVRNGTVAVALSHYARDLVATHVAGATEVEYQPKCPTIQRTLEKAVAAVWKSYSLCPLPIFLYYRAIYLQMLGFEDWSHQLFVLFLKKHSECTMDYVDRCLLEYDGIDVDRAVAHAKQGV